MEGEWKDTGHSRKEDCRRPHHGQGQSMTCNVCSKSTGAGHLPGIFFTTLHGYSQ